MDIRNLLVDSDLLCKTSTPPGRVRSYIKNPEKRLLPYSCKLHVYQNNLSDFLHLISKDLRWGAGVKVVLDNFGKHITNDEFEWSFIIGDNVDFDKITPYQSQFLKTTDIFDSDSVINVGDFMDSDDESFLYSIERSWVVFYHMCVAGKNIVVDLSRLRPNGTKNSVGLEATGAVGDGTDYDNTSSFLAIYEAIANFAKYGDIKNFLKLLGVLNNTLRRGGLYKNGIVTSSMRFDNPNIWDYLNVPIIEIPGSHKKAVRVNSEVLDNSELLTLIVKKVATESVFLEKFEDGIDDGLYWNVCEGLKIPDKGTCLIWRVNLGMCHDSTEIVEAYKSTAYYLIHLHHQWRLDNPQKAIYSATQEQDLQIGIDIMGLANLLAIKGVTYKNFNETLEQFLTGDIFFNPYSTAGDIILAIWEGMLEALKISDSICEGYSSPKLERMFTVEPAQSHSFETVDVAGFTTCRGIFPPTTSREKRVSSTTGKHKIYNHGGVETIANVGGELLESLCDNFQKLMNLTGRAHGISYDLRMEPTEDWFKNWLLNSSLQTKYYTEFDSADQSYLDKVANVATCDISRKGECAVCAE